MARTPLAQGEVLPPCQAACPAGIRARDYVALVAQGRFLEAARLIRERMPFIAACGRICYHPCEGECNRGLVDEPVAIMALKRFISDYEFSQRPSPPPPPTPHHPQRVAVVGAGPCGLAAAQDLVRWGYPVALFEAQEFPGGTVRIAIPRYKLPRDRLDWDIYQVLAQGVELQTKAGLGRDFSVKELKEQGYAAIALAPGADRSRRRSHPQEGVFAEGDFAPGTLWTVDAVGAGHRLAEAIRSYLEGTPPPNGHRPAKRFREDIEQRIREGDITPHPRAPVLPWDGHPPLGPAEIEKAFTEETAIAEARRCLSCGSAEIISEKCVACLTCLRVCPYDVPAITPQRLLTIREDRCQGCGICVGECPVRAIIYTMPGAEDLPAQLEALLPGAVGPGVVALFCSYTYPSPFTHFAHQLPLPILPLAIPCFAKLDVTHFLKAFELGASALVLVGCQEGNCSVRGGFLWGQRRALTAQGILAQMGLGAERIITLPRLPGEMPQLYQELQAIVDKVRKEKPNPLRRAV